MMLACTLLLVSCGIATAAKYDRTVVKQDDTTYWVDFFPANEKRPYRVVFFDDMGTRSKFRFNSDGLIRGIRVDQERFSVKYTSSNDLKRVETRGSRSRVLAIYEEEDEDEGEKTEEGYLTLGQREFHNHAGRRLNTCDECKATWDILCDTGVESVCDLVGYDDPLSSAPVKYSVDSFCTTFEAACESFTAAETCVEECPSESAAMTTTSTTTDSTGITYNVSPEGEPYSLTEAVALAGPGDTISLADGTYREPIVTRVAGEDGNPLVFEGGRGAVISAFSGDRSLMWSQKVVDIRHSWITLRGFTIDGHLDDQEIEESFVDKCIWVEGLDKPTTVEYRGKSVETSLIGFSMYDMHIRNCGMECVRMRNWVTHAVIVDNFIEDCGIYDYRFQFDGKIGEGVYIGTSSNQWTDGPDGSNYNLISGNNIIPRGNECVDVKEGASFNVIEYNTCAEQLDEHSGCYDSRGNANTFRFNSAEKCTGAGIRLGGHVIDGFTYGVDNDVYGNDFKTTSEGSIKSRREPQGLICGNSCDDDDSADCEIEEVGDDEEIEGSWDKDCPATLPIVPFIDE